MLYAGWSEKPVSVLFGSGTVAPSIEFVHVHVRLHGPYGQSPRAIFALDESDILACALQRRRIGPPVSSTRCASGALTRKVMVRSSRTSGEMTDGCERLESLRILLRRPIEIDMRLLRNQRNSCGTKPGKYSRHTSHVCAPSVSSYFTSKLCFLNNSTVCWVVLSRESSLPVPNQKSFSPFFKPA